VERSGLSNQFPATDWDALNRLKNGSEDERRQSLDVLCNRYREPVLNFLQRSGYAQEPAEDLLHDFFAYAIEKQLFEKAKPQLGPTKIGRFRNLVLSALKNYAKNARRWERSSLRYPAGGFAGDDVADLPVGVLPHNSLTPEIIFVRDWAKTLIRQVLAALKAEYAKPTRQAHHEIFYRLMIAPMLEGAECPSHRTLAGELGLTEKEVASRLGTARSAYQRLLRAQIASYANSEAEIDEEIRELFQQLS
jgi:DNA-directed RNA polymerase specialized sigma24 family protein